jgi:diguanylate cyclase (GGDEF)-like protein/PAS domain S-box-containing protein
MVVNSSTQESVHHDFSLPTTNLAAVNGFRTAPAWDAMLQQIGNSLPAMIWMCGVDGRVTVFNKRWLQFTGRALQAALDGGWIGSIHPDDACRRLSALQGAIPAREPFEVEYQLRRADGEYRWMLDQAAPRFDTRGEFQGYVGVAIDITERKLAEDKLRWLSKAVEQSPASVVITDLNGNIEYVNPKFTEVTGYAREEVLGQNPRILKSGETPPEEYRKLWETIQTGEWRGEFHNRKRNGELYWEAASVCPIRDETGKPAHYLAVKEDITVSRQAEASQARLAAIVECSNDAIMSLGTDGVVRSWNAAAERLYGYSASEILACPAAILTAPGRRACATESITAVLGSRVFAPYETEHMRKDGSVFPASVTASPIRDSEGKSTGAAVIIRDITEQKRSQQALKDSENRFRAIVQNSNDIITLMDPAGGVLYDSPGAGEMLGLSPAERLGCDISGWLHPDELSYVRMLQEELLRTPGIRLRAQLRLRHADGTWRWCDSWLANLLEEPGVRALVSTSRDITELKDTETALRESEQRYRRLIEDASDAIFTIDLEGNFTSVNAIAEQISGYNRQELLGMNLTQIAIPEHHAAIRGSIAERIAGDDPAPLDVALQTRDGHHVSIEVSGRLQLRNSAPVGLLCIARDISQRKRAERLEHNRREVLEMVAQNQPLEIILRRLEEMIEQYYPGATARISVSVDLVRFGKAALLRGGNPTDFDAKVSQPGYLSVPIRAGDGRTLGSLEVYRPGAWQPSEAEKVSLDSKAKLAAIALEHRQLTNRLAYDAQHDPLTGLPNRLLLDDRLQQAITLARRQARMVAVIYVDLDRFKFINDTLGHHVGDLLLKDASGRMQAAVRESDTLARTGGDEFVAVLFGIETQRDAEIVADRIVESMREPFQIQGHELFTSASVGLSLFPRDGEDGATLQKHADVALYDAKNRGRNRAQVFAREMNSASHERLEIENDLHRAMDRGELVLYYQPQYQIPSRQIGGVEALLRWNHPKWGLVLPGRFVPVAEETGLIIPIGLWVLREACRQHQKWCRSGFPQVRMAVNISATQFMRSNLAERVAEVLAEFEMEPRFLELELTEGVLMRDADDSALQIAELRTLGVRISIDDFGTGYSSLGYLQRLPIDDLKIDKCFVQGIGGAANTQRLVQAIVGLAHGLNVTATAEGVETEDELEVLRILGCDRVQGFLLGRPAPAEHWEHLWRQQ